MPFNHGRAYVGSGAVTGGKLTGRTGRTEHFFFICPACNDNQTMRILDYEFVKAAPPLRRSERKTPRQHFDLSFQLYCPVCQFEDFVKIDNDHRADKLEERKTY
jgi:hypothetical protein